MILKDPFEFVILGLAFEPSYSKGKRPQICMKRDKKTPHSSIDYIHEWMNRIILREKSRLPANSTFRYSQWRVFSGDTRLFTVDGVRFDRITIFMGEDANYWLFYQHVATHRRIEGSSRIPLKFCACCLNRQYIKIMDVIKRDCLTKPSVS